MKRSRHGGASSLERLCTFGRKGTTEPATYAGGYRGGGVKPKQEGIGILNLKVDTHEVVKRKERWAGDKKRKPRKTKHSRSISGREN